MTYLNLIGSDRKQRRPLSVSVTFGLPQRVRTRMAYLCLFVLLFIYLAFRHYVFLPSLNYIHPDLGPSNSWGDESTLDVLMETYDQARLSALSLTQADLRDMESVLGMPNASLISDRYEYLDRVQDLAKKWFSTSSSYANMTDAINRARRGDPRLSEIRPVISSTCKGGRDYAPVPFIQWEDIIAKENEAIKVKRESHLRGPRDNKFDWQDTGNGRTAGQEWGVDVMDDEGMEATFVRYAGEETAANSHLWRVWDNLNFVVLKTDLLRYMMLQHDGGLYTDSDTVPRLHPEQWAEQSFQGLPDSIAALQRVIGKYHASVTYHQTSTSRHTVSPPQAPQLPWQEYQEEELSSTVLEPDVSVVMSIEGSGDWTPGATDKWYARPGIMPRRIQIVQWTMMSKAFHPIFIDVVGTVLDELERQLDANSLNGSTGACQLTGPGPFTDAVFRYLLATQGVTPYDLAQSYDASGTNLPGRFGDVVVYNQNSFSAHYNGPHDTRTDDVMRPVAHMYWGRWKNQGWD